MLPPYGKPEITLRGVCAEIFAIIFALSWFFKILDTNLSIAGVTISLISLALILYKE